MMKQFLIAIVLVIIIILLGIWASSQAAPPMCQLTGTVADIYGNVGKPYRISYVGVATQNTSSVIVPGKSSCSTNTDNAGNLPTSGPCFSFIQGVVMQVTVGSGQPVQVQVPLQASVDLSTLILANSDPPSLVTGISVASGGDYTMTVTNPPKGTVGQAVIAPGSITTSGTWTPTFLCYQGIGNIVTPFIGGGAAQGMWVKFGNMVYVQGTIVWSTSSASPTGAAAFSLPFTPVGYQGGQWGTGCCNNPAATFPIFISNSAQPANLTSMQMGGISTNNISAPVPMAQMLWYGGGNSSAYAQNCASSFANGGSGFSFQTVYRIF